MAKFLEPKKLRYEVKSIFEDADNILLIVSPFIKLDYELKHLLESRKKDSDLHITLLFGKNDNNIGKSLSSGDLSFFQQFENIEIYYHSNLHAKYYANEYKSIITSLNLHTYSMANNIEVGVMFERKRSLLGNEDNREDDKSFDYFMDLIENEAEEIFIKTTETKSSFFGLFKSKEKTKIEVDNTYIIHHQDNLNFRSNSISKPSTGFCIRTGISIPFDMNRPFSKQAYNNWAQFENYDYPEKFCHFSGEKTNGQNSCAKPVLYQYYKKALELQNKISR